MGSTTTASLQADNSDSPKNKKQKRFVTIVLVLLLVIGIGLYELIQGLRYESTDDAFIAGNIVPISERVSGHVLEVRVDDGQFVKAGDVLVVIDPHDYQVAVDQAQAAVTDAKAQVVAAKANVPLTHITSTQAIVSAEAGLSNSNAGDVAADHNVAAAQAAVAQAEANAVRSDADLRRYSDLLQHENVSKQQYDQALATARGNQAALDEAKAMALSAQQASRQAKARVKQSGAELHSAQTVELQVKVQEARANSAAALLEQREAELQQATLNLSYTVVRAPVDGVIGQRHAQVGQNVAVGQELLSIAPIKNIWVTANFKETQLKKMRPGQAVAVRVDAFGGRAYQGHVTSIGGATGDQYSLLPPENATGNFVKVVQRIPVRIDFNSGQLEDGRLRMGMSVEPEVTVR